MTNRPTPYPPQSGPLEPNVIEIGNANGSSIRLWPEQVETYELRERGQWEAAHPEERKARLKCDAEQSAMADSRHGQPIRWNVSITRQTPMPLELTAMRLQTPCVERKLTATNFDPESHHSVIKDFLLSTEFGFRNEEEEVLYKATQMPSTWWSRLWDSNSLSGIYVISKLRGN